MGGPEILRGPGRLFALYVAAYTVGRGAIEALRVDHANHFLGLRLNDWTSVVVFLAALTVLAWPRRTQAVTENRDAVDKVMRNGPPAVDTTN